MRGFCLFFLLFCLQQCFAQNSELELYIDNEKTTFDEELRVFMTTDYGHISANDGPELLKNDTLDFSRIEKLLVVYGPDTLDFFEQEDFARKTETYQREAGMPTLKVPTYIGLFE